MALFGPRVGQEALFDEVCKFHGIEKKMKMLLQTIVKKYRIPFPVKIFIEPDALMQALSDGDFAEESADLHKLYDAWFVDQSAAGKRK